MIEEIMVKLGFSPSEIKIYLHLLKTGSSYANKISFETKINRTNVYEALDRLAAKGVISHISKNKVKWYEATNPDSLITFVTEKEEELNITKKELLISIKDVERLIDVDKTPLEASIFTGKKGLRMLFEDIIRAQKPISLIAAELQFRDFFGPYFELWHKKRIEKKIMQRTIFPMRVKNKVEKRKFLQYKFADYKFTNPTTTIIYGNNCLFIQWSKEPIAVKITNKEIAKSHLNYFDVLWVS
ncbi:MAG TPA: helix-turn-helix domain-containing protein [Candidatus Nanoarchaeia archaeon]|nr:helix-turn-helix domain-containing protein [Candidatus Nanoarchaeia archaeon]